MVMTSVAFRTPLPEALTNAPQLWMGLELYWMAFTTLSMERPVGFGLSPIPDSAIEDYARAHDLDDDTRQSLRHHIRGMDRAFREYHDKNKE